MLMPSHAKNVKHYADSLPLFSRFQVESYLSAMFNPTVQLKSGGYIVIDVTEALVAIDVNSGRATREASIEETALKTNMEAAEEAARQMRLRDLAGLIVIDFIDMEDRRNNAAVEKKLKDKLKTDRARIQVGRISAFGLLEMSRQRLRPGMIEATTKACPHCHGTGRVRSDDSMALALLREIEEEGVKQRSKEVLIVAPVEIANYLLNQKREHIAMIEAPLRAVGAGRGRPVARQPRLPGGAVQDRLADHPGAGEPEPADGRLPRGGDRGGGGAGGGRGGRGRGRPGRTAGRQAQAAAAAARRQGRARRTVSTPSRGARRRTASRQGGRRGGAGAKSWPRRSRWPCRRRPRNSRSRGGARGAARPGRSRRKRRRPSRAPRGGGDHRPRRGAGVGDRRGARGRRAAAAPARAGAQAGDGGAGRGHLRRGGGDHAGAARAGGGRKRRREPEAAPEAEVAAAEAEAAPEPEAAAAEAEPERAEEGPKRRGWWSRALSS